LLSSWRGGGVCECGKFWGISLVAEGLLASQEELCPMEMVNDDRSEGIEMYVTRNLVYAFC
jgi:hypothetical protein